MSGRLKNLPLAFSRRSAEAVARDLLGRFLVRTMDDGSRLVARIVETEAYLGEPDRASHAWNGRRTARNASLYLPGGHWYVYFIYGMHHCLNVVAGAAQTGGAALIRAAEIIEGQEIAHRLRGCDGRVRPGDLAGGPGRLCRALAIDRVFDGRPTNDPRLRLTHGEPVREVLVASGPRIGVAYAGEAAAWPLRFAVRGHPEVSRPRL